MDFLSVSACIHVTVETVVGTLRREGLPLDGAELIVSGGGRHNRTLTRWLREALPGTAWRRAEALGVPRSAVTCAGCSSHRRTTLKKFLLFLWFVF